MKKIIYTLAFAATSLYFQGCRNNSGQHYTVADFERVPKIDAHFHYDSPDLKYLEFADSLHFRLLSPNVDAGMPVNEQLRIASSIRKQYPGKFAFMGTFPVNGFFDPDFAGKTISLVDTCMKAGASGIKIWKNIGMDLRDSSGVYIMVTDPILKPVFDYIENHRIPLLAHLGEPKNCWLPLEEMTLGNDRNYFREHPRYHMFLHPGSPSYMDQIHARDSLLLMHPRLDFTGAHLASLEWSVDELAARFEQFPLLKADMAARIGHLQYQSAADREKVRNFILKYQDRIMYATDEGVRITDTNYVVKTAGLRHTWLEDWIYLATDSLLTVKDLGQKEVKGLRLPREVIDKIFFRNAARYFQ